MMNLSGEQLHPLLPRIIITAPQTRSLAVVSFQPHVFRVGTSLNVCSCFQRISGDMMMGHAVVVRMFRIDLINRIKHVVTAPLLEPNMFVLLTQASLVLL